MMDFFISHQPNHISQYAPATKLGFNDQDHAYWSGRLCGLVCLAMTLDAHKVLKTNIAELTQQGVAFGGYNKTYDGSGHVTGSGWLYTPLVKLARHYGLHGQTHRELDTQKLKTELLKNRFVVVSVNQKILRGESSQSKGGHLILTVGIKLHKNQLAGFYVHDPAKKSGPTFIPIKLFNKVFGKRGFSIWC